MKAHLLLDFIHKLMVLLGKDQLDPSKCHLDRKLSFIKNNLILKGIIEGHGGANLELMPFFYLYEDLKVVETFSTNCASLFRWPSILRT